MKLKYLRNQLSATDVSAVTLNFYLNKYYSLFMNRFKFKGVDYQQADFILRKMWGTGTICAFKMKETIGSNEHPQGLLVFVPYEPNGWNIYDYPTSVHYMNTKGVKFIPYTEQVVDKDCVIGWCQRNKKSVKELVTYYIMKIVNIELVIDLNLNAHKMPYVIGAAPEDTKVLEEVMRLLQNNEPQLFVNVQDVDKLKALVSGAPYILDKLYDLKQAIENELREYLGLDNLGGSQKKEHLITAEVESNNQVIQASGNNFIDCMKEFFERIRDVLGVDVDVEINEEKEDVENQPDNQEEEETQDEDF